MKYRHSFHAGNFADVHKHVGLLALLRAMQRKDKGFLYVDTHAGAGSYDLGSASTHHGAEAKHGITAVMAAAELTTPELCEYRLAITAWRRLLDDPRSYPGSPALAAQVLRGQDRALCCEVLPRECRALERALGGFRRVHIECDDGYRQLYARLPPQERRSLILLDPPYESPAAEIEQAVTAISSILAKLANAVIALWYPIKDERWLLPWQQRIARALAAPAVGLEFWLYPRDARVGLNGSGLLVINPPYQFEQSVGAWQHELTRVLDGDRLGGSAVRVLVPERDTKHADA